MKNMLKNVINKCRVTWLLPTFHYRVSEYKDRRVFSPRTLSFILWSQRQKVFLMNVYIHTHTHASTCRHTHAGTHIFASVHTHTHAGTDIHTHPQAYTHTSNMNIFNSSSKPLSLQTTLLLNHKRLKVQLRLAGKHNVVICRQSEYEKSNICFLEVSRAGSRDLVSLKPVFFFLLLKHKKQSRRMWDVI